MQRSATNGAAGSRIGRRIRKIREAKDLSKKELGIKTGLSAKRISQLEEGRRRSSKKVIEKLASALGVTQFALEDPDPATYIGAMYALFELEENHDFRIEHTEQDGPPRVCLSIDFQKSLYSDMQSWHEKYVATQGELQTARSEKEKERILSSYNSWKWNFPQEMTDKTHRALKALRLSSRADQLQTE